MAKKMDIETIAPIVAGVGALNVGLAKFVSFDLIALIPGGAMVTTIVYGAIGLSGGYVLYKLLS